MLRPVIGLLITKNDSEVFGEWCDDQLELYEAVVCLDGSDDGITKEIAASFPNKIHYLHEQAVPVVHRSDHGLRAIVHQEIVRRFGHDNWIMCCHADEFCYHDPRRIAQLAEQGDFDLVSWFSPHFYPHTSEYPLVENFERQSIRQRFRHFHWGYENSESPWIEDRLYRNGPEVGWDGVTHGSVRPCGIEKPAPFHPIYQHYKVCSIDLNELEEVKGHALYANHWNDQEFRTGLPFLVRRVEDLFISQIPRYRYCDRFEGTFSYPWNMGEEYRFQRTARAESYTAQFADVAQLTSTGDFRSAHRALGEVQRQSLTGKSKSAVCANRGVLAALEGKSYEALASFRAALALDRANEVASANIAVLGAGYPAPNIRKADHRSSVDREARTRIAIVSHLFNWPSTGGGTIHTKELADFLERAGFDVLHIFARYKDWGIGRCEERLRVPLQVLECDERSWHVEGLIAKFRAALREYNPDYVVITDSWNFKPWMAQAAEGFPYVLRYQALENLCPLNNVRLLPAQDGNTKQCGRHQLATPAICHACCRDNEGLSGALHRADRALSGVGTTEYDAALRRAVAGAEAILVVNPLMQAMFSPWNERTFVVPAGMDAARFIENSKRESDGSDGAQTKILFAGLVEEYMKGFHVLIEACDLLWRRRQNFELLVTAPPRPGPPYARFIGWLDQRALALQMASVDILAFPTVAQEALGRTAVEAMAAGVPVVASRIGGLPFTITDGLTGLLTEPGNSADLAEKLAKLIDDPPLRRTLGANGRRKFHEECAWPVIIDKFYKPLFAKAGK